MTRFLTALAAVLVLLCVAPTSASAVPVSDLCTPDGARGGVPADFALDACVDASSMTVRNDLGAPVLVRRDGDVGVPVRVHERGSAAATVLRLVSGTDELLMPGDVVRWPLGPAAGSLAVADLEPATAAIADTIGGYLPRLGADADGEASFQPFALVIRQTAAAIADRTACVAGKNFLQAAACDVAASSAVSRIVIGRLPRRPATEMLPLVLDPRHWADWFAARPTDLTTVGPPGRTLAQAAVPAPVVVPPPVVPPPAPAVPAPAPAVPAPAPAVAAPAVVPTPDPSRPQVPGLPGRGTALGDWLEDALGRLGSVGDANGNGNGQGQGHGDGHSDGRGGD